MIDETINIIAPCGINCSVCLAYMREKKRCPGCRDLNDTLKPFHCTKCSIKYCDQHQQSDFLYCFDCKNFPCTRLKKLDTRYTLKYKTSIIANLTYIKENGLDIFIKQDEKKWICSNCGSKLCIHKDSCPVCGCKV